MGDVELIPEPLTRAAFAPFGDVIEVDGAHRMEINNGTTERFHNLAAVDVTSEGGHPLINIFGVNLDHNLSVFARLRNAIR